MPELTLCQVRTAANSYLANLDLPRATRYKRLADMAHTITRQQQRNARSRRSHRKKTIRQLKQIGIQFRKLGHCKLE